MGYSFFDFTDGLLVGADEGCGCFFGLVFKLFLVLLFIGMVAAGMGYVVLGGVFAAKWLWGTFGWLLLLAAAGISYLVIRRRQAKRHSMAELASTPMDIMQHQELLRGQPNKPPHER